MGYNNFSVRKVDNGFLVASTSDYDQDNEFVFKTLAQVIKHLKEFYSERPVPVMEDPPF